MVWLARNLDVFRVLGAGLLALETAGVFIFCGRRLHVARSLHLFFLLLTDCVQTVYRLVRFDFEKILPSVPPQRLLYISSALALRL